MKKQLTMDEENVYYPVSEKEYLVDLILSWGWDILLVSAMIYLIINYSGWGFLLVFLGASPTKIAKRAKQ